LKPVEVLLVEDAPGDIFLVLQAFDWCSTPVNYHLARDGEEALQMLRSKAFDPDLVILDLTLPKRSGYEVLEQYHPDNVPVVVFSASEKEADARRSVELGAREFIRKPDGFKAYVAAVQEMIEKWAVRKLESTSFRTTA
jgi:chemotaxis family two-component system response regulator Rcp1